MRASEPLTALRGGQMRLEEPGTAVLGRLLPPGDSYAPVSVRFSRPHYPHQRATAHYELQNQSARFLRHALLYT